MPTDTATPTNGHHLEAVDLDAIDTGGEDQALRTEISGAAVEAAALTVHASIIRDAAAFYRIDAEAALAEQAGELLSADDVRRAYLLSPLYQVLDEVAQRTGELAASLEEAITGG